MNALEVHLSCINTLRPRQNGRHFADAIFKWIFLNENVWIPIKISLKFVPQCPINNIPALVQIMAWRRHYLDQWWLDYRRIYASLCLNELTHQHVGSIMPVDMLLMKRARALFQYEDSNGISYLGKMASWYWDSPQLGYQQVWDRPGARLNTFIKMPSYQYRDPHVKDKTVSWPSYLYHGNPHTPKGGLYIETGPWFTWNILGPYGKGFNSVVWDVYWLQNNL